MLSALHHRGRHEKKALEGYIFCAFFFLFLLGVVSALLLVVLFIFGYFPLGELLSQVIHFFYIHYMLIPVILMVFLIIAIVVIYLFYLLGFSQRAAAIRSKTSIMRRFSSSSPIVTRNAAGRP